MTRRDTVKLSLYSITWPIFIEMSLQMLMRTTDVFMLSNVSDEAVAAVGVSNQIIMIAVMIFQFVAMGTGVVVSQYLGAKKTGDINDLIGTALGMNILFGVAVSAVVVGFSQSLLSVFDLRPDLNGLAENFLVITGAALVIQALFTVTVAIIQSYGYTKYTMAVTLAINLLNILGNYLFIFGPFGFPVLGVTGVAISTVVSQLAGLIVNFLLLQKIARVRLKFNHLFIWKQDHIKSVLKIGIPSAAVSLSYNANQFVITALISSLGAVMLTTYIYTKNIMFIVMVMGLSISKGMQIIVGRLVGAEETEEAYKQVLRHLMTSIGLTLAAVLLLSLFRVPLIQLFTEDAEIIKMASILLLLGFLLEPARNFNVILEKSLQAAGDARFPMVSAILIMWMFSVPFTYLLGIQLHFGLYGIFAAFVVDEWLRGMVLFFRWRSRKWEGKRIVGQEEECVSNS